MANSQRLNLLLLALGIALVYWTTKPDENIAFDRSCNVIGLRATISEAIYGKSFWEIQLASTDEALEWLERAPAADLREREGQSRNPVEQRMTRLSDKQGTTAEEQAAAKEQEQKDRFDQMAWLTSCDAVIRLKLNQ